jgi:hypothetical protein
MLAVALLVMIGLGATTTAQTVSTNHVIGWTERGATTAGELQIQDIDRCAPAKTLHQVLGTPTQFWSGGTAYDPRHESVWVTARPSSRCG